jgi:lipid-A-disaccharide synthase-like uncharacterized protein
MWSFLSDQFSENLDLWVVFGLTFQFAFMARFLVQWIASERQGKSVIPISFWYLSLIGSTGVLIYGIGRGDMVIILGQCFGTIVYVRNLALIYRERRTNVVTSPAPPP